MPAFPFGGSRRRRPILGVAAVLAVVALSGCAGGRTGPGAETVVAAGASKTLAAHTFRFQMTIVGTGQPNEVQSGEVDLDHHLMTMVIGADPTRPPDQIAVGGVFYERSDLLPMSVRPSTPWAKSTAPGGTSPGPGPGPFSDPSSMLDQIRANSKSFTRDGDEVIRGVPATRYRAMVTLPSAPPGTPPTPTTLWVDRSGRIIRMATTLVPGFDNSTPTTDPLPSLTMQVDFSDFGAPVSITIPKPSQVTDVAGSAPTDIPVIGDPNQELASIHSWTKAAAGSIGSTHWTFETGTATDRAACSRLRLDPPDIVPSLTPQALASLPPGAALGGGAVPVPPVPPILGVPASPADIPPPPAVLPPGIVPPGPASPPVAVLPSGAAPIIQNVDASGVVGNGASCGDLAGAASSANGIGWAIGNLPLGADSVTARSTDGSEAPVRIISGRYFAIHPADKPLASLRFTRHGALVQQCQFDTGPDGSPPPSSPC